MDRDCAIIVAGVHRSGTSLLRRLLNGQPGIFCPPEIKFHKDLLGQYRQDPLAHARLGRTMSATGLPVEVWLDALGRGLVECYELAARRAGKRRWADKNPENCINVEHWYRLLGGRLAFVLVVRNPLDVLASMAEAAMNLTYGATLEERVEHMRNYLSAAFDFFERHRDVSFAVAYEALVEQPGGMLESLCAWLGEDFDARALHRIDDTAHGCGVEDPKVARNPSVVSASVGRWRRDLTEAEIEFVVDALAPLARRLGMLTALTWDGFDERA